MQHTFSKDNLSPRLFSTDQLVHYSSASFNNFAAVVAFLLQEKR